MHGLSIGSDRVMRELTTGALVWIGVWWTDALAILADQIEGVVADVAVFASLIQARHVDLNKKSRQ